MKFEKGIKQEIASNSRISFGRIRRGGDIIDERKSPLASCFAILGKVLLTLLFAAIITVLLAFALGAAVLGRRPDLMGGSESSWQIAGLIMQDPLFAQGSMWAQFIGFAGGVFAAYALFERRKGWPLGFGMIRFRTRIGEGFAAGFIFITASCALIWLFRGVRLSSFEWSYFLGKEWLWGFLLFIGVALNEELFARGYLQGLVKNRFGSASGVAVSALVFALLHSFNSGMWSTPLPILNLLLAGLLFGVSREASGGLWMPVGMHVSWNFFQGNIYGFLVSGMPTGSAIRLERTGSPLISGGSFGAEGSLVTTFVLIAGTYLVYAYYQTKSRTAAVAGKSGI